MLLVPGQLILRQEAGEPAGLVVLCGHLFVEIPVVLHDAVHGSVQLAFEIRAVPVHAEEGFRKANLADGQHVRGVSVGIQRHKRVDFAALQHGKQLRCLARQLRDLGVNVIILRPLNKKLFLNAVFVDADKLSVKGRKIIRPYLRIVGRDKDMVVLRAHAQSGIEDLLRARFGIGHVAEQVDLPRHQHLKQLGPAALDIFILPAGKGGDPLLVFIAVAGAPSELIRMVKG